MVENGRGGLLPLDKWTRKLRCTVRISANGKREAGLGYRGSDFMSHAAASIISAPFGLMDRSIERRSFPASRRPYGVQRSECQSSKSRCVIPSALWCFYLGKSMC